MSTGSLLSVLSLFAMSVAPILNKFASGGINYVWAAALSSGFCCFISFIAEPKSAFRLLRTRQIFSKTILWIAITNSIGLICQYGAVARLDPATLSILGRMYVVFAVVLAQLHLKETMSKLESRTLLAVFVGAILFCWRPNFSMDLLGVALCLAYCFFFALTHLQVKQASEKVSSNAILLTNNFVSAVILVPVAFVLFGGLHAENFHSGLMIFGAAFFGQWLGLLLFYESLKRIPMVQANLIRTFSPIVGVLVSWPFFPVSFSRSQIAGAILMVSAIIFQSLVRTLERKRLSRA